MTVMRFESFIYIYGNVCGTDVSENPIVVLSLTSQLVDMQEKTYQLA